MTNIPYYERYEKFKDAIQLASGISDSRYFDYYFEQFLDNPDDEMYGESIKELFVLLKLTHGDKCPDYSGIEARRKRKEQEEKDKKIVQHNENYKKVYAKLDQYAMEIADMLMGYCVVIDKIKSSELTIDNRSELTSDEQDSLDVLIKNGWVRKLWLQKNYSLGRYIAMNMNMDVEGTVFQRLRWDLFIDKNKIIQELSDMFQARAEYFKSLKKEKDIHSMRDEFKYSYDDSYNDGYNKEYKTKKYRKEIKSKLKDKLHERIIHYMNGENE